MEAPMLYWTPSDSSTIFVLQIKMFTHIEKEAIMSYLASSKAFRFRWINGQCFEFQFNNGKTLLTDPWYQSDEPGILSEVCIRNFTTADLEGADYVFLNHTHGDHICNLQDVVDRFHSTVITHSATALHIAKTHEIPLTSIYPVDYEGTYYFDGFMLEIHHGTHHAQPSRLSERVTQTGDARKDLYSELNAMGGMVNTNFVLTTDNGMRVAFIGGNDDGMIARLQGTGKPNVIIRNKMASSRVKTNVAENFAEWFAGVDTQVLIPMHYETWLTKDPEFAHKMIVDMNRIMAEKGKLGRVAPMERGKWYTLNIGIREMEE